MYGCRHLKSIFNKSKCTLLIAVVSTAIISLHLQYVSIQTLTTASRNARIVKILIDKDQEHSTGVPITIKPNVRIKHYDVLISGYMRSGSTLTGTILGWRTDSFYLYEPFLKSFMWNYWHGNDTVCRSDRLDCRTVDPRQAVEDNFLSNMYNGSACSLVMAMKVLRNIYDCQFNDFERTVFHPLTARFGGPSWSQTYSCIKDKKNSTSCLRKYIHRKCQNATHRVTKVLRLSTDLLANLLNERENLKVIHLFRDPRAIINSRIKTRWFPIHAEKQIIQDAKALCKKMLYDFKEGQKLLKLFPNRFKVVYYEDLSKNTFNKSKALFKYLGMDLDVQKFPTLRLLTVFSDSKKQTEREKNTAFWWRKSLSWDILQKIDLVCKGVYTELGYLFFKNVEEYQNISLSTVDIPKEFLIKNIYPY
ncbi:carbohydrate sulfotransferase 1-like isoform X2 [Mercenaria mercenaria]|uniref:carbohydrate sulfotransferase 1-like isoform X2 n=1 Tax=Mercenaria mercenaria TaxID=6596 RepID=UPI00234F79A0|nr:carbohydrate sulfotransferase 1-like isoform X2 [Mercenaria mercenaria]